MKKRVIAIALVLCIICAGAYAQASKESTSGNSRINIMATIFPEYDWVKVVLGDNPANIGLSLLLDSGIDLHSFQPTPRDIVNISTCDLFIYVGGESDEWVDDVLEQAKNPEIHVINLLEVLGDKVKEEEVVEGMEHDHDHDHDDHEDHDHDHEEAEYDEHVWLSLANAGNLVSAIAGEISLMDPANAAYYKDNATKYIEELSALDAEYRKVVSESTCRTLLFGDRFPFRYLVDDYGLDYYAAFSGCSAESEASFETVAFLVGKVDELALPAILTIEKSDKRIAQTIRENTKTKDQAILEMDSMQSTTARDVDAGTTYIGLMESNLEVLKQALN